MMKQLLSCGGASSCENSVITIESNISNSGIYCSGYSSCRYGNLIQMKQAIIYAAIFFKSL